MGWFLFPVSILASRCLQSQLLCGTDLQIQGNLLIALGPFLLKRQGWRFTEDHSGGKWAAGFLPHHNSFLVSSKDCPTGRRKPPVLAQDFNKASLAFPLLGLYPRHIYSYPSTHCIYKPECCRPWLFTMPKSFKSKEQLGTGALVHNSGIHGVQARRSGVQG